MNIIIMADGYSDPKHPEYLKTHEGSFLTEIIIQQAQFPSIDITVVVHPEDQVLSQYLESNYEVKLARQELSSPLGSYSILKDIVGDCVIVNGFHINILQSDIEKFIITNYESALCKYKNPWHPTDVKAEGGAVRRSNIGTSIVKISSVHKEEVLSLKNLSAAAQFYKMFTGRELDATANVSDIDTYLLYSFFFEIWSNPTKDATDDLGSIFIDHDIYSRNPEGHLKKLPFGSRYSGKTRFSIRDLGYRFRELGLDEHTSIVDVYDQVLEEVAPIGRILGVGESAVETSIFNYPYFRARIQETECIGINIDKSGCGVHEHFKVFYGTSHKIDFPANHFDCVISCMHLEHDPNFWLSLQEMKRVLRTGGLFYVGVRGFVSDEQYHLDEELIGGHRGNGTIAYELHGDPDCYRFSPHWITYVAFPTEEFSDIVVTLAKIPPRLIITGRKR